MTGPKFGEHPVRLKAGTLCHSILGTSVIVKAFAIVIIGGFGNVEGTIIAGLAVGLVESFATQLVNPGLTDLIVFTLLLLMLAFRPTGLIAEKREENV